MKAGVYLRVSSEEQVQRGTIDTQRQFAERYCALHQIPVHDFYADDGVSGTVPLDKRPEGERLLADARDGKITIVLLYRLDRLGRDPLIILNAVRSLELHDVELRSMTEPFDTSTPSGRLMLTTLSGFAGFERDSIIARSMEGSNRLAREGAWLGGICPFGYRVIGKGRDARIIPSETLIRGLELSEADVVRFIYRSAGEGRSCVWIADKLTEMDVPPAYVRDGREVERNKRKEATSSIWRPSRVRNLLINSTYKGIHRYGKRPKKAREVIEREVPPLVSADVWEAAQTTLRKNQLFSSRNAKRKYLLRGLIKCGLCGLTYVGTGYPEKKRVNGVDVETGKTKFYYTCNGKHGARGIYGLEGQRCPAKAVPGAIEDVIWTDIEHFLREPGEVLSLIGERLNDEAGAVERFRAEAAQLEKSLRGKASERDTVVTLYRKGRIDESTLNSQLDVVAREEAMLKAEIESLNERTRGAEAAGNQLRNATSLLQELNNRLDEPLTWETKREIVENLVEYIRVDTEGTGAQKDKQAVVTVRYRFRPAKDIAVDTCRDRDSSRPRG